MRLRAVSYCAATVVACHSLVGAAQPRQDGDPDVNPLAATLVDFRERIEKHMELRDDITDEVGDPRLRRILLDQPADVIGEYMRNALSNAGGRDRCRNVHRM
jgi:hypothetical protein